MKKIKMDNKLQLFNFEGKQVRALEIKDELTS